MLTFVFNAIPVLQLPLLTSAYFHRTGSKQRPGDTAGSCCAGTTVSTKVSM